MGEKKVPKREMADLHDIQVEAYLVECVRIEPMAIQEEFVRVASDLAYWSSRYSDSVREYLMAKLNLDEVVAKGKEEMATATGRAAILIRDRLTAEKEGGRVTESMVQAALDTDAGLVEVRHALAAREYEARLRLIEADTEKSRLFGFVDAVRSKRDMLVSLGATQRKEMEADPSIREQSRSAKEVLGRM